MMLANVLFIIIMFSVTVLQCVIVFKTAETIETVDKIMIPPKKEHLSDDVDYLLIRTRILKLLGQLGVEKVIIWGHPYRNTNTFSFIHGIFYKSLRMFFPCEWVDPEMVELDKYTNLENILYLTEGTDCDDMPISDKCYYFAHNVEKELPRDRTIGFQFFSHDSVGYPETNIFNTVYENTVFITWGTDLLPEEFKKETDRTDQKGIIVGQRGEIYEEKIRKFQSGLINNELIHNQKFTSTSECIQLTHKARFAPALMNQWQKDHGYAPCRVFKNISYGQPMYTTSNNAHSLLLKNGVYKRSEIDLAKEIDKEEDEHRINQFKRAWKLVRSRHTYLNKWETMLMSMVCKFTPYEPPNNILYIHDEYSSSFSNSLDINVTVVSQSDVIFKELSNYDVVVSTMNNTTLNIMENIDDFNSKLIIWGYEDDIDEIYQQSAELYSYKIKFISRSFTDRYSAFNICDVDWGGPFADLIIRPHVDSPVAPTSNYDTDTDKEKYIILTPNTSIKEFIWSDKPIFVPTLEYYQETGDIANVDWYHYDLQKYFTYFSSPQDLSQKIQDLDYEKHTNRLSLMYNEMVLKSTQSWKFILSIWV
jgi:hypothetical protein